MIEVKSRAESFSKMVFGTASSSTHVESNRNDVD